MMSNNKTVHTVKCITVFVVLLGFCGRVYGEVSSETSSDIPNIQDIQDKLKDHLPDGLPALPVNVSVPTEEEAKELLKKKCDRIGGPEAYNKLTSAREEFQTCVMSLVNMTELTEEMEKAKPTGDLDQVFRKYCRKSPIFKDCISNFTSTLELCLEEKEKESKHIVQNITEALLNFLCFKEGDRIALFIAEGGPECFEEKKDEIQTCANETFAQYIPKDTSGPLATLPLLVLDKKECRSFLSFQKCVVNSLEGCKEPTPANIVESLFLFVTKLTPCETERQLLEAEAPSSASAMAVQLSIFFLTYLVLV